MGVDFSVSAGVGVKLDNYVLDTFDLDSSMWEDGLEEGFWSIFAQMGLSKVVDVGVAGSYYDNSPNTYFIIVKRTMTDLDQRSGVEYNELEIDTLTSDEKNAILAVLRKIGHPPMPIKAYAWSLWS